ncbi:MAG: hypothetical protein KGJ08_08575 [Gammaproteobacteria bacterium]|nr:hypothetical protein [Gammaproteobacteria bacterium]
MRPMTFITGVIFASAAALAGVLGIILFLRFVMTMDSSLDQTVIRSDLPLRELVHDMGVFAGLALVGGMAFWGQLARRRWRWPAQYLLAVVLGSVLIFFLARQDERASDLALFALMALLAAIIGVMTGYTGWLRRLWAWFDEGG